MQQKRPDLAAYNGLNKLVTPEGVVGHIPGIKPGERVFKGKGELAVVGLHCDIPGGIYHKYAPKVPSFSKFFPNSPSGLACRLVPTVA